MDRARSDAGDVAELYASLSRAARADRGNGRPCPQAPYRRRLPVRLEPVVASPAGGRRETALSWLITTAVHEASRLLRGQADLLSLEREIEELGDGAVPLHAPPAADLSSCGPDSRGSVRSRCASSGCCGYTEWASATRRSRRGRGRRRGRSSVNCCVASGSCASWPRSLTDTRPQAGARIDARPRRALPRAAALASPALGRTELARLGRGLGAASRASSGARRDSRGAAQWRAAARIVPDEERDAPQHDHGPDRDHDRVRAGEAATARRTRAGGCDPGRGGVWRSRSRGRGRGRRGRLRLGQPGRERVAAARTRCARALGERESRSAEPEGQRAQEYCADPNEGCAGRGTHNHRSGCSISGVSGAER